MINDRDVFKILTSQIINYLSIDLNFANILILIKKRRKVVGGQYLVNPSVVYLDNERCQVLGHGSSSNYDIFKINLS